VVAVPVILTLDDGPDPVWTPRMLDELARLDVSASFFPIGERVAELPMLVREVVDAGHEVGLHCQSHIRHSDLTEAQIEADTCAALGVLEQVDVRPTRWRTPWGVSTPASERVAERHGLELVGWTIDTHDWRGDTTSAMLERAADELTDASIVLMHDGLGPGARRGGCEPTAALIGPLVTLARSRGFEITSFAGPEIAAADRSSARVCAGAGRPR
jgi:peptidoglycan-N-acetylglucosamine deacetylase